MRRFAAILGCCLAAAFTAMAQVPKVEAVVNAATFQQGLPTGGALATVFISGFNDPKYFHPGLYVATNLPLPNQILKTNFLGLVPGQVGLEQVNFVVPANQQRGD